MCDIFVHRTPHTLTTNTVSTKVYRVAKTHRIPYLYWSISVKVTYN